MNMTRRDMLKLTGVTAAAAAMTGCGAAAGTAPEASKELFGRPNGNRIVVIGGGFGGLTIANELKKIDDKFDVIVIEKNDTFMSCPFSNTYLGKIDGVDMGSLIHDYAKPVEKFGYQFLQGEVTAIDRNKKIVTTTKGTVTYDILVLSPGIAYNYKAQFPNWSEEKIEKIQRVAPGALIPGKEHVILERQLKNMDDGDVIITVPAPKFRCPPAPFERASMIANFMKKEDINGKVIILNETESIAKGAAFKESWKDLYGDMVEHHGNCKIIDVDTEKKEITYEQTTFKDKEDVDGTKKVHTRKYQVLNLIPVNKSNPVVEMSGVETTSDVFGKVKMNGCSFQTLSDKDIYAVGDVVGHAIPPSGQTAVWSAKQCAKEIAHRLHGKSYSVESVLPFRTGNVCYSMVGGNPDEAIMVTHDFSWDGSVIKGKGNVPKDEKTGKFRTTGIGKATRDWYAGIMRDLFS